MWKEPAELLPILDPVLSLKGPADFQASTQGSAFLRGPRTGRLFESILRPSLTTGSRHPPFPMCLAMNPAGL